jgi:uncharacterized protein YqgV (UPF0045/DUF77 family)
MVRDSGVDYRLTPMGTVIETENLTEALAVVARAALILQDRDCRRIYSASNPHCFANSPDFE